MSNEPEELVTLTIKRDDVKAALDNYNKWRANAEDTIARQDYSRSGVIKENKARGSFENASMSLGWSFVGWARANGLCDLDGKWVDEGGDT